MNPNRQRTWCEASPSNPCPACRHTSWCRVSTDGAIALCRRVAAGCYKAARYRDGSEYYIHRIHGAGVRTDPSPQFTPQPTARRADADTLHRVYAALLDGLDRDRRHVKQLRGRGLAGDLKAAGYRTWPLPGRSKLARRLIDAGLEPHFPFVPGFRQADDLSQGRVTQLRQQLMNEWNIFTA